MLNDFLREVYATHRLNLSTRTLKQYDLAAQNFERWAGRALTVRDFSDELLLSFMRHLLDEGLSATTVNNYRKYLLLLWNFAYKRRLVDHSARDVPKLREQKRVPNSWTISEMAQLADACRQAPTIKTWTGQHWLGLVLTLYDSGLRVGCLMNAKATHFDCRRETLFIPAENSKGRNDEEKRLHPDTAKLLSRICGTKKLFDWPFHVCQLQSFYRRDVLKPAGMPHGRRDLFHKIRRTSYTLVYKTLGLRAASDFASHTCDLSAYYLDRSQLNDAHPLSALPRPA